MVFSRWRKRFIAVSPLDAPDSPQVGAAGDPDLHRVAELQRWTLRYPAATIHARPREDIDRGCLLLESSCGVLPIGASGFDPESESAQHRGSCLVWWTRWFECSYEASTFQ